jgi:hypothetical protein
MKLPGPDADDPNYQATYSGADMENDRAKVLELDAPRRKKERVMATLTDKAVTWLTQQPKDRPFFLYFTPVAVHNPVTPDTDLAGALLVAQQIGQQIFDLQIAHADSSAAPVVTVSLGVCSKSGTATGSALALLSQADAQLYAAKAGGRHRTCGTEIQHEK